MTTKNAVTTKRRTGKRVRVETRETDLHAVEDSDATDESLVHKREKTNRSPHLRRRQVNQHLTLPLKTNKINITSFT